MEWSFRKYMYLTTVPKYSTLVNALTFLHWAPDRVKEREEPAALTVTYTHEGLEQAGCCEEPQHAASRRHRAPRHKPQQQIGQDAKRSGKHQPVRQTASALSSARRRRSHPTLIRDEVCSACGATNQPWSEFADGCPVTAAHQISNQRVRHSIPSPTHK